MYVSAATLAVWQVRHSGFIRTELVVTLAAHKSACVLYTFRSMLGVMFFLQPLFSSVLP
jgi:hypothetical protein